MLLTLAVAACDTDGAQRFVSSVERDNPVVNVLDDVVVGDSADPDGVATVPADTAAPGDTSPPDDTTLTADTAPPPSGAPIDINSGWIGGACADASGCDYTDGDCVLAAEGFPNGHCTQACDQFCPDQDGAVTTFCIDEAEVGLGSGGLCVARCDFGESPTGCRDGYMCKSLSRHNDPARTAFACVPGDGEGPQTSACVAELQRRGIGFELGVNQMSHPDGAPDDICDVQDPVWVDGTLSGVDFRYASSSGSAGRIYAGCALALAMDDMAQLAAASGVTDLIHLGVYSCRFISDTSTLSEHAFANAIDISGARFDDGSETTVLRDWERGDATPETPLGQFWRHFANDLCDDGIFHIILTPETNAAHLNHLHLDLKPNGSTCH